MIKKELFIITPKWKQSNVHHLMNEQMWSFHTMRCFLTIKKRNAVLIHATTWMKPENMLRVGSQSQTATYCMILFL